MNDENALWTKIIVRSSLDLTGGNLEEILNSLPTWLKEENGTIVILHINNIFSGQYWWHQKLEMGFPGESFLVDESLSLVTRDMGSILGPGRSH